MLTAACLSLPHARYLHQFWWPQDDCSLRRPHASSPNLPRYRRGAANLSKAREKGSSDDNKARPIFHENEVLWHSLQWPGRERETGGQEEQPNEWMQSSYHVEFFFIRDVFSKRVTGGSGSLEPWVMPWIRTQTEIAEKDTQDVNTCKSQHFKKVPYHFGWSPDFS